MLNETLRSAEKACCKSKKNFDNIELKKEKINQILSEVEKEIEQIKNNPHLEMISNNEFKISETIKSLSDTVGELKKRFEAEIEDIFLKRKESLDYFTISFFGITNAGKSTIIEALAGDKSGLTIGEGKQNTTKEVSPHHFGRVRILDTPGFEGGIDFELLAENEIQKTDLAIFVASQKAPEVSEIEKITKWVKQNNLPLLVVLNQRNTLPIVKNIRDFSPTKNAVEYTNNLLSTKLNLINFKTIPVNAQIAFFARCKYISEEKDFLIKAKASSLNHFRKHDLDLERYSNFREFENEVQRIIIEESEIIKLKNIYDAVVIFSKQSQIEAIKHKASFDKTKRFLSSKIELIKKEFGSGEETGGIGTHLYDTLVTEMNFLESYKARCLSLIDQAIYEGDKNVERKLKDETNNLEEQIRGELLPNIAKKIQEVLENQLRLFQEEMELEISGFINISDISDLIIKTINDYKENKLPQYLHLAFELISTAIEVLLYIFLGVWGLVATGVKMIVRWIFGSAADRRTKDEEKRNQKRIEAREKFLNRFEKMKEDLTYKLWNGFFDKNKMKRQQGIKDIIFEVRRNILTPVNNLYFVCKDGARILDAIISQLRNIQLETNRELLELTIEALNGKPISLKRVIRNPGTYADIFCKDEDDLVRILKIKKRLSLLLRDKFVNIFVWNNSKQLMIHQLFNSFSKGNLHLHDVVEISDPFQQMNIIYSQNENGKFPANLKNLIQDVYNQKVNFIKEK